MAPDPDPPPPPYQTDYDPNAKIDGLPATATIVEIYPAIMRETPADLLTASQGWSLLGTTIWGSNQDMLIAADQLRPAWQSDAAEYFFPYIDRTRQSLGEWEQICYTNAQALSVLSETVDELQRQMQLIWENFTAEQQKNYTDENSGGIGEWFTDVGESMSGDTRINDTLKKFTEQAQSQVSAPFSNAFTAAWSALSDAPSFRGPKDAEMPADGYQQRLSRALMPTMPGGTPGAPRGLTAPASPSQLGVPAVTPPAPPIASPAAPVPPAGPSGMPVAPVAPPLPVAPVARVAPVAPIAPIAPVRPGSLRTPPASPALPPELAPNPRARSFDAGGFPPVPGAPGTGGAFPGAPAAPETGTFEHGAAPAAPGELPETGLSGGLGGAGSRLGLPTSLQGRGAGPGSSVGGGEPEMPPPPGRGGPGVPPPGRSMPPGLPGRNRSQRGRPVAPGSGEPGEVEFPGAENRSVPSLLGRAGRPFGAAPRNPGAPLSPAEPDVPRGLHGMRGRGPTRNTDREFTADAAAHSSIRLDGRFGASGPCTSEALDHARSALRPGLDGRRVAEPDFMRPVRPAVPSGRRDPEDRERGPFGNAPVYVGIDERFEIAESTPAVIERPVHRPTVAGPGPTLDARTTEQTTT